nr:HEAT repeat domain-containing protein [Desulfobulbaceae bacterium]
MGIRAVKEKVTELLRAADLEKALIELSTYEQGRVLKPLLSSLCSCDKVVKWHAVTAIGQVVGATAETDFESARVVMRRFMWMLNDESGGIGWGIPEVIGEVCAVHPKIAQEYTHILVSFMREEGFYLELPELQRGLMWGLGRLAQVYPQLLVEKNSLSYLPLYLGSADTRVKAGAVYATGLLNDKQSLPVLHKFVGDSSVVTLYKDRRFEETTLGALAREAISLLQ